MAALQTPLAGQADCLCEPSGSGTDYRVGSGQMYTTISDVPWGALGAEDAVRIFYRSVPYRDTIVVRTSGTQAEPIRICSVPGPNGERPILGGDGAVNDPDDAGGYGTYRPMEGLAMIMPWNHRAEQECRHDAQRRPGDVPDVPKDRILIRPSSGSHRGLIAVADCCDMDARFTYTRKGKGPGTVRSIVTFLVRTVATREASLGSAPPRRLPDLSWLRVLWPLFVVPLVALGCSRAVSEDSNGVVGEPRSVTYAGMERTYRLYIPSTYDATRPVPLVMALHGGGGTGKNMVELTVNLNGLADAEGFIVVYPDGVERHWNDGRNIERRRASVDDIDDVGFIASLIGRLSESYAIDPRRVYALGISNGGMMSYRLACELSGTFAGIAAVTASMSQELVASCDPSQSTSVLVINGDEDPLMPWEGGTIRFRRRELGEVVSTADTIAFWVAKNGCSPVPAVAWEADLDTQDGTRVRSEVYGQCRDGAGVTLYAIEGGGHTWPSGLQYLPEWVIGKTSRDINANETIWQFFKEHT